MARLPAGLFYFFLSAHCAPCPAVSRSRVLSCALSVAGLQGEIVEIFCSDFLVLKREDGIEGYDGCSDGDGEAGILGAFVLFVVFCGF